jgi:hypothetical protein
MSDRDTRGVGPGAEVMAPEANRRRVAQPRPDYILVARRLVR